MKLLLSWLKEYLPISSSPKMIADQLTSLGIEIDGWSVSGIDCQGVIVAEIVEVNPHPQADKLVVVTVNTGQELLQIVCGDVSCRSGIKVALAKIGAELKDPEGKPFKIKESKLRGVVSFGMLCAADEIGLEKESQGILHLPLNAPLGSPVADLYHDIIFEVSLTPNLNHCASVRGVARELSVATGLPYLPPQIEHDQRLFSEKVGVDIQAAHACPSYAYCLIKDVKIQTSPDWLKRRLELSGIRPVNNVVDVTNYVLLEMGHPLHAFDFDQIRGGKIIIRKAQPGEETESLDGKQRKLNKQHLVIADSNQILAIAGIMGSQSSEVNENTQNILLEAAYFDPVTIRMASRDLNLSTDASKKFERGTDPNQILIALNQAARLIVDLAGGAIQEINEMKTRDFPPLKLQCRFERVEKILGVPVSQNEVEAIFKNLNFQPIWHRDGVFEVTIPTYRSDIQLEIDLIEEIARFYGYERIIKENTPFIASNLPSDPVYLFEKKLREILIGQGLQEFLTSDLIGPTLLKWVYDEEVDAQPLIKVLNPNSVEQSLLRVSLLPGLLQVVKHNIDHQNKQIAGFEIGRVHFKDGQSYKEPSVVGIVLSGEAHPLYAEDKTRNFDFYDLKGIVESFLHELGVENAIFKNLQIKTLHSGRQASIFVNELEIGSIGEVHPAIQRRLDVEQKVFFGEFNIEDLMQITTPVKGVRPLINFPGIERDWTITIRQQVPYAEIIKMINVQASPILEDVFICQPLYSSEKLPEGYHNLTLRFKYRDSSKTIEISTVEQVHKRLITAVLKGFKDDIYLAEV